MENARDGAVRVNLWTMTRACVYLSSPIDHHLKQEERGRETRVQFSTLAHEETRQLRGNWTLAREEKVAFMCVQLTEYIKALVDTDLFFSIQLGLTFGL